MRNCTTKSVILAPFNSTRTHLIKEGMDDDENDNENED